MSRKIRRARRTRPPITPPAIAAAFMWGADFVVEEGEFGVAVGAVEELAVIVGVTEVGVAVAE